MVVDDDNDTENEALRGTHIRHARSFDYATLTVIAVGVSLWFSWPRAATEAHARVASPTYISYTDVSTDVLTLTREPLLFVGYARSTVPTLKENVSEMYADFVASQPSAPVDLPQAFGPSSMLDLNSVLQGAEQDLASRYHPQWDSPAVFALTNVVIAPVRIDPSSALKGVNLQFPEWNTSFKRFSESSWSAVFELSGIGAKRPDDVFVIESSGNRELDQWFVRKLYASRADKGSGPWRGQVSISTRTD